MSAAERLELRQREAVTTWKLMVKLLELDSFKTALPKSSFCEAITYLCNQWDASRHYLTDGNIPIDNNHSERAIRPLTIGRKIWMCLGSKKAAPGRMKLFSFVSSVQRHCLSIQDYLEDILFKLSQAAQHNPQDLELGSPLLMSLLPDRWAATHPQHVQHVRLAEKRQVAEDKQLLLTASRVGWNTSLCLHRWASIARVKETAIAPLATATRALYVDHRARKNPEMRDAYSDAYDCCSTESDESSPRISAKGGGGV